MKKNLDCENDTTLLTSISHIINMNINEIKSELAHIDLESEIHKNNSSANDVLYKKYNSCFIDNVYWFHFTRQISPNQFQSGLKPVLYVIDEIWDFLYYLATTKISKSDWELFRKKVETSTSHYSAVMYQEKLETNSCSTQIGPYGFLIKHVSCVEEDLIQSHYLKYPEIVYHICDSLKELEQIDIFDLFEKNTKPCIVKFQYNCKNQNVLGDALYLLYCLLNDKKTSVEFLPSFTTRGKTIPQNNIVKIDYL